MRSTLTLLSAVTLATATLQAQGFDFLYTTSQNEITLSGSGGTVLRNIHPNDIVGVPAVQCMTMAEKWLPRQGIITMAGDENGDDNYWQPGILGSIDALIASGPAGSAMVNGRTVWYSPSVTLGNVVSGGPGLRPGDIGRIVRNGGLDGKVQHFIRQEQINQALGLPIATVIDVDAAAFGNNQGLYLSLDTDIACSPCGGPTLLRDGDVFCIPPGSYTLTGAGTIGAVAANSAVRIYTEAQIDTFVANASVADRFGACVPNAIDLESLEIDIFTPSTLTMPTCVGTAIFVPTLLFTTETLTGGAILTTAGGGQIYTTTCGLVGTPCAAGPTLGNQVGLRPVSAALGVPSYLNALASTRIFTYAAEAKQAQIPAFTPAQIDFNTPGFATWVFMTFAPTGPGAVAPSTPFAWGFLGFPDYYMVPNFMGTIPGGFGTYTSPAIPFVCDLVFQGVTITTAGTIEASTPTMVEVF